MKKVLVIDDEIEIQALIANFLRNYGVHVEAYANGLQASKKIKIRNYDLIITDLKMPEEDGFSIVYKARYIWPNTRKTPIIIITGAGKEAHFEIMNCNLDQHRMKILKKPFEMEKLLEAVCEAFHLEYDKIKDSMIIA